MGGGSAAGGAVSIMGDGGMAGIAGMAGVGGETTGAGVGVADAGDIDAAAAAAMAVIEIGAAAGCGGGAARGGIPAGSGGGDASESKPAEVNSGATAGCAISGSASLGKDLSALASFSDPSVLSRGTVRRTPQTGQNAFLPARNDLTFSLWPFGQRKRIPIASPLSTTAASLGTARNPTFAAGIAATLTNHTPQA